MVSGDRRSAAECAEANVRRLRAADPGAIVFPCGSCLLMFKRNVFSLIPKGTPLYDDAVFVADRAVDYASFLLSSGVVDHLPDPPQGEKVGEIGYHDPCPLSGTLGKGATTRPPRGSGRARWRSRRAGERS
jgi:Fe-S oxidoreductase